MTDAMYIFVALIAFVGGWGLSLVWRGLFPRAKVGAPELGRCPSCGKALDYRAGLKCACGNRARSAEDLYRPVRSAKVVLLGLVDRRGGGGDDRRAALAASLDGVGRSRREGESVDRGRVGRGGLRRAADRASSCRRALARPAALPQVLVRPAH